MPRWSGWEGALGYEVVKPGILGAWVCGQSHVADDSRRATVAALCDLVSSCAIAFFEDARR